MRFLRPVSPRWIAALTVIAACSASGIAGAETLSAEDAVRRAAESNPTLRAALLDAAAAQQAVQAEVKSREPVLAASVTGSHNESINSGGSSTSRTDSNTVQSNVALRYTTDVGTSLEVGTAVDIGVRGANGSTSANGSTGAASTTSPTYSAQAYVTARQPLLKGAGSDAVLAPRAQAQASANAAVKQSELTASQTALDVLNAYWELWYAEQALAVQEKALAVAEKQLADARVRADTLGTASQVDVLQFSSQLASIKESLSQARATQASRAIELGRTVALDAAEAGELHAGGELPSLGAVPSQTALTAKAQEQSLELAALRADLTAARSRVTAANNANQPRLDVFATVTAGALWANDSLPGLSLPGARPAVSVVGGVELELPIGGGRASADAAKARTQLQAAEARYEARSNAINASVSSLRVTLEASGEQSALASETARVAAELAQAERQRLVLGTTTSADVVRAEQTAREAELRRLRTQVSQVTTRFQLDHATGALLDRFASTFPKRSS